MSHKITARQLLLWGIIFIALSILGMRVIIPKIDWAAAMQRWQPVIQQKTGVTFQFEQLLVEWDANRPQFHFKQISLKTATGHTLLVNDARFSIAWWRSLWHQMPVFSDIALSGAKINVQQLAKTRWHIPELDLTLDLSEEGSDALQWLWWQEKINLQAVVMNYHSLEKEDLPLQLEMHYHSLGLRHKLALRAQNLSDQKKQINLMAEIKGQPYLEEMETEWFLQADGFDLNTLKSYLKFEPWDIKGGDVDFKLWGETEGTTLMQVSGEVQANDLLVADGQNQLPLTKWQGMFSWRGNTAGWELALSHTVASVDSVDWPKSEMRLAKNNKDGRLRIYAERLPLRLLAKTVPDFPSLLSGIQGELRQVYGRFHPQDWQRALWSAQLHQLTLPLSAATEPLTIQAQPEHPGSGLMGEIYARDGNLQAKIHAQSLDFKWTPLFRSFIPVTTAAITVQGQLLPQGKHWHIWIPLFHLESEDGEIQGQFAFDAENKDGPYFKGWSRFQNLQAKSTDRYLPAGIMTNDLVTWLDTAIVGGKVSEGAFAMKGPLAEFPYVNQQGQFVVFASFSDMLFRFDEYWPALKKLQGQLLFDGPSLEIWADGADLLGGEVTQAQAFIPNLMLDIPKLTVSGQVKSDARSAMAIVHQSPLRQDLGRSLDEAALVEGNVAVNLDLKIPLDDRYPNTVQGSLDIQNGTLLLLRQKERLTSVQGTLQFYDDSFRSKNLQATILNQPFTFNLKTLPSNGQLSYILAGEGRFDTTLLQKNLSVRQPRLSGQTPVRARLTISDHATWLQVESDLRGVKVDLPAPFKKSADEAVPFEFKVDLQAPTPAPMQVKYGQVGEASFSYVSTDAGGLLHVDSSALKGEIHLPHDDKRPVIAQFERLYVQESNDKSQLRVNEVPRLRLTVQDLRYGERQLGFLTLNAEPVLSALQIQANIDNPGFAAKLSGKWDDSIGGAQTNVQGALQIKDIGKTLKQLNHEQSLVESRGEIGLQLKWPDNPLNFALAQLQGEINIQLDKGRLIEVDPGAGRVISLLSLNTLRRRLSLDFSDLFKKGFSFDKIAGRYELSRGDAVTCDMRIKGTSADIAVQGRTGLVAQDYDQWITVTPQIAAGLPIAGVLAINPAVGAAVWAAKELVSQIPLGDKLIQGTIGAVEDTLEGITRFQYHMEGTWDKPNLKLVGPLRGVSRKSPLCK